jgi:peptide/nickel transport system substrate-binding protein
VRLSWTFILRFKALIILGIIFGFVSFSLLNLAIPQILSNKAERIGISGRFSPEEIPLPILNHISMGLTKISEKGAVIPGLAKSWSTPDKGKTWIFELKDNITWQDGTKLVSQNINYNFEDLEIERNSQSKITFKLKSPYSPFPSVVSKPIFKKGLLGVGDWKVTKLTLAGNYVENLEIKDSAGKSKIFKFYPTEERTKLAYKLGEIDIIENLVDPKPFTSWKTVNIKETINFNQVVAIFFNLRKDSPFEDNKALRQALYYAIDKKDIGSERAISPIAPYSWAYNPQTKTYDFDRERAIELISSIPTEAKDKVNIKLVTTSVLLDVAEKIAKNWGNIGIKTTIQVAPTVPENYDAFLGIYEIPPDPDQYATWHSTQELTNISHYKNPRIDKLLEDGRLEVDFEKRRKIYLDFQRFLAEDAPAAFLYHPTYYTITRK